MVKRAKDLISVVTRVQHVVFISPDDGKVGEFVCKILYVILLFFTNLVILQIAVDREGVETLINTLESLSVYFQSIIKIPPNLRKKDLLRLMDTSQFWDDPQDKFIKAIYSISTKILIIYTLVVITGSTVTLFLPYFTDNEGLNFYIPPIKYADIILSTIQTVQLCFNIFYVVGLDILFTACCIILVGQFHILGKVMTRLDWTKTDFKNDLNKCIQHHCFLIDYMEHLQNVYSRVLFVQYLMSLYSICLGMIKLAQDGSSFAFKLRCLLIIFTISMQLAGYIMSAYFVTTKANEIGEAIYSSNWYDASPKNQKLIELIIVRSQKPFIFHGLGIFMMTRESYLSVFKSAVSLYTFLMQMKEG